MSSHRHCNKTEATLLQFEGTPEFLILARDKPPNPMMQLEVWCHHNSKRNENPPPFKRLFLHYEVAPLATKTEAIPSPQSWSGYPHHN